MSAISTNVEAPAGTPPAESTGEETEREPPPPDKPRSGTTTATTTTTTTTVTATTTTTTNSHRRRHMSELLEPTIYDLDVVFDGHEDVESSTTLEDTKRLSTARQSQPQLHSHGGQDDGEINAAAVVNCRAQLGYESMEMSSLPETALATAPTTRSNNRARKTHSILMESAGLMDLDEYDDDFDDNAQDDENSNGASPMDHLAHRQQQQQQHEERQRRQQRRRDGIHQNNNGFATIDPFDVSYRPGRLTMYLPPLQRQRWGQTQVLPRINWGDLFFDLFYVGAAYNTSNILVEQPDSMGVLYFLGTFLTIMQLWLNKTFFDARFVVAGDDLYHRIWEMGHLVALSNAIVHIQPVEVMSHTTAYVDTFSFCISVASIQLLLLSKYIELYVAGRGQCDVLRHVATREGGMLFAGMILQMTAAIIAGMDFYGSNGGGAAGGDGSSYDNNSFVELDGYRWLAESVAVTSTINDTSAAAATTTESISSGFIEADMSGINNTPIWLCLFVPILYWLNFAIRTTFLWPGDGYSHKKFMVPINVGFTIHRDGEWTLLMFGESILSLLIEDIPQEDSNYFWTFYCSLMTVILLQYLHFRSQPHDADDHVIRRSKNRSLVWKVFLFVYASSLIALGASLTIVVRSFSYYEDPYNNKNGAEDDGAHRFLAGGGSSTLFPPSEMRHRASCMFSISLAFVFLSMDMMSLMHVGFKHGRDRCYCTKSKWYNKKGILLLMVRVFLIGFTATLSLWMMGGDGSEQEVVALAGTGLAITVTQIITRRLGEVYLSESVEHVDETVEEEDSPPAV